MPPERPEDFDVDFQLTRLVRRVRARSLRSLTSIHESLDYSTFVLLLAVVDAEDGVRASDLADAMHVHKSTVSRAVRSLETMGLLERSPHPQDRRAHVLRPTAEAVTRVEAYRAESHRMLDAALEDWDPAELRSFAEQLAHLNTALDPEF